MRIQCVRRPLHPVEVKVYDGNGDRLLATVTPFPGFEGTPSVAMGDVDGDGILDLVVGAGKGHAPEVVASRLRNRLHIQQQTPD